MEHNDALQGERTMGDGEAQRALGEAQAPCEPSQGEASREGSERERPTLRRKLLAYRNHSGIGDWLFSMYVLNAINRQHKDVDIYLSLEMRFGGRVPLIREIATSFGVRYKKVLNFMPDVRDFDLCTGHMVYKTRNDNRDYIVSMADVVSANTGLSLDTSKFVPPVYRGKEMIHRLLPDKYVVMIGHGKRENPGKDWGFAKFDALCTLLRQQGIDVVQIGAAGDQRLSRANVHFLGTDLQTLIGILRNADCLVSIPNGMMVLAGMNYTPQFTIYCGEEPITRSNWPGQIKRYDPTPAEVYSLLPL